MRFTDLKVTLLAGFWVCPDGANALDGASTYKGQTVPFLYSGPSTAGLLLHPNFQNFPSEALLCSVGGRDPVWLSLLLISLISRGKPKVLLRVCCAFRHLPSSSLAPSTADLSSWSLCTHWFTDLPPEHFYSSMTSIDLCKWLRHLLH